MVLFLYASLHIPGTGGAETHHCIYRAVGKLNYHNDATIGFERSDPHCWKSMLLLPQLFTGRCNGSLVAWNEQASKGCSLFGQKVRTAGWRRSYIV